MLRPTIDPRPPADIIDLKTRRRFDLSGRAPNSHPMHRHIENLHERVDALEAQCREMEDAIRSVADDVTKLADLGHRTDATSCVNRADTLWRLGSRILVALRSRTPEVTHTGGAA